MNYPWIIDSEEEPELKGVRVRGIESFNDGDVTNSLVTYDILKSLNGPAVCIDIGADQGWWSAFCLEISPGSHIYAYEPNTESFKSLLTNISGDTVHLFNAAVSNKDGVLHFQMDGPQSNSRENQGIEVPCKNIGPLFEELKQIDFVKIDTEGHEPEILFSLEPYWNKITAIVFEYTVFWYSRNNAIQLIEKIMASFPYVYILSRRIEYCVYGPLTPENYIETIYGLYNTKLQVDILASRQPVNPDLVRKNT